MTMVKKRGGSRLGAGRKPLSTSPLTAVVSVRVTPEEAIRFKKLGGSAWLRAKLKDCKEE